MYICCGNRPVFRQINLLPYLNRPCLHAKNYLREFKTLNGGKHVNKIMTLDFGKISKQTDLHYHDHSQIRTRAKKVSARESLAHYKWTTEPDNPICVPQLDI